MDQPEHAEPRSANHERLFVFGPIIAAAVVYALSLITSLLGDQLALATSVFRLAVLAALAFPTIRRVGWARWMLVAFLAIWAIEQIHWALRGDLFGSVASPIFIACAVALASRPASRYLRGAV